MGRFTDGQSCSPPQASRLEDNMSAHEKVQRSNIVVRIVGLEVLQASLLDHAVNVLH